MVGQVFHADRSHCKRVSNSEGGGGGGGGGGGLGGGLTIAQLFGLCEVAVTNDKWTLITVP